MVRIIIKPASVEIFQQAQFDLPLHDGSNLLAGDLIYIELFGCFGPIQIVKRTHRPEKNLLNILCVGEDDLLQYLVEEYPNVDSIPDSAQLPPQNWAPP